MTVAECVNCGYFAYPPRLLCPVCGGSEWRKSPVGACVVTEVTMRRPVFERRQLPSGSSLEQDATRLGAVRSDVGVRILARLLEGIEAGDRVALVQEGNAVIAVPGRDA